MSVKLVLAALCAVALCSAQSDPTPAAKVTSPEVSAPGPAPEPAVTPMPARTSSPDVTAQTAPDVTPKPGPQVVAEPTPEPAIEKTVQTKAPEPPTTATAVDPSRAPYIIGALDVLVVKVWGNTQLSGVYDVHQDGQMSIPLIGDFKAEGLTTNQVATTITKKLDDCCIRTPIVNVEVGKNNSKWYTVYGEVGRAGQYPLSRATTVMDALADVGGFRDFANVKKIRIQRDLPDGKGVKEFLFNYKDVSHGKNLQENILLQHGDRIFVGQ